MEDPLHITIATPYLPYPDVPHGGGQDLFQLIRFLVRRNEVRVVSFADEPQAANADALRPFVTDLHLVWPAITARQKWSNVLSSLRSGRLRHLGRRAEREMRQIIASWPADVLHCAWTEMGRYLDAAQAGVVRVLDEVDVRFLAEQTVMKQRRWASRRRQELAYCRQADLVLTRSSRDLSVLQTALPDLHGLVLPPVAHVAEFVAIEPAASVPGRVLFVGAMNRYRNQAAATWLAESLWPSVRTACPGATLRIVGANPPDYIRALGQEPGIVVTGWVEDLGQEYARARVIVAPMRSEAGALNKVLDALAAGRPVVATEQANAGIGAPTGAIIPADTAEDFAAAIVRLLGDDSNWRQVGLAGRRYVQENFDWPGAVRRYQETLLTLRDKLARGWAQ